MEKDLLTDLLAVKTEFLNELIEEKQREFADLQRELNGDYKTMGVYLDRGWYVEVSKVAERISKYTQRMRYLDEEIDKLTERL